MTLGPGPPRKGNRDRDKGRIASRGLQSAGQANDLSTGASSVDTVVAEEMTEEQSDDQDQNWNRRRYQREDEMLWGIDGSDHDPADESLELSETHRSGGAGGGRTGNYYVARNPAVNDLHPPIVSTHPAHRSETKWMLQPPPSAKIMEGKERAQMNRRRSGSGGSYGSSRKSGININLGRRIGEKAIEEKVKKGERPPTASSASMMSRETSKKSERPTTAQTVSMMSREPSRTSTITDVQGQPHDRDARLSSESRSSDYSLKKQHPPPITISEDTNQRFTILPSNDSPSTPSKPPLKPLPPHLRPILLSTSSASSLHILQELVSPSALNLRSRSPLPESRIKLPPASEQEDWDLALPECESWFPGLDFRFPNGDEGENERGVRVRGGRWSADF